MALSFAWPLITSAETQSERECVEGGDFIRNAARARDNGVTREFFIGHLEEDFVLIRSFAPASRWFVHDEDDEAYLRAEVEAVFDAPQSSEQHRADFLKRCERRAGRLRS
ncbi:MAG TPA: hypothetical protein VMJ14_02750 [Burkholderiales bacterium]|nr:hypothetical protein [Burkholderiales bacterium]